MFLACHETNDSLHLYFVYQLMNTSTVVNLMILTWESVMTNYECCVTTEAGSRVDVGTVMIMHDVDAGLWVHIYTHKTHLLLASLLSSNAALIQANIITKSWSSICRMNLVQWKQPHWSTGMLGREATRLDIYREIGRKGVSQPFRFLVLQYSVLRLSLYKIGTIYRNV